MTDATENTPLRVPQPPAERPRRRLLSVLAVAAFAIALVIWLVMQHVAGSSATPASVARPTSGPSTIAQLQNVHCGSTRQETGYIKLPNKQDDYYFYWYHESQRDPALDPFVVWFTGGPGCSGLMALLTENGPCRVQANLTTTPNPFSWNRIANVLWIEQPTNVGFSYSAAGDADSTEVDVQNNFYGFLQEFFNKHPELRSRELFIAGESYAGHYVPAVAHKIWKQNKAIKEAMNATKHGNATSNSTTPSNDTITAANLFSNASQQHLINLKGIAIGNGIVNFAVQVPHALDMLENRYYNMSEKLASFARGMQPKCLQQINQAMHITSNATEIMTKLVNCTPAIIGPYLAEQRNPYDIRKKCTANATSVTSECFDYSKPLAQFLNSPSVKHYLNVSTEHDKVWQECNAEVSRAFYDSGDILASCSEYVADLLNDGQIRMLVYAGDADTVCNWAGNLAWMTALNWTHQAEFDDAIERPFTLERGSIEVGRIKAFRDLFTFIRVFDAGHMVSMDQPAVSFAMINKFISNQAL